jgi:1-acyl-sn-glycerol-3-phosphate acyltransferase
MSEEKFIDVKALIESKSPRLAKWLPRFVISYLKRILHQDEINDFILKHKNDYNADFCDAVVDMIQMKIVVKGLENIPKTGPIVIAMNHPLGGMDAMAFVSAVKGHRTDLKFIVNDLLMNLTNLQGLFVGVNKYGKTELSTRQQIMNVFESEEAVCIFPAGLVSRKQHGVIRDLEWKKTFVRYAVKYDQPIIPVYIDGKLSPFFYRLSNFRKFLGIKVNIEMLYLADELYKQKNKTITFIVGEPILPENLNSKISEREQAQNIKESVYKLAEKKTN